MNWNQADTTCKALGFGARLATFFTSEAIRLILDLYWASGPDCTDSHKGEIKVTVMRLGFCLVFGTDKITKLASNIVLLISWGQQSAKSFSEGEYNFN